MSGITIVGEVVAEATAELRAEVEATAALRAELEAVKRERDEEKRERHAAVLEMAKARRRVAEIEGSLDYWMAGELEAFLAERSSGLAAKVWTKAKRLEQELKAVRTSLVLALGSELVADLSLDRCVDVLNRRGTKTRARVGELESATRAFLDAVDACVQEAAGKSSADPEMPLVRYANAMKRLSAVLETKPVPPHPDPGCATCAAGAPCVRHLDSNHPTLAAARSAAASEPCVMCRGRGYLINETFARRHNPERGSMPCPTCRPQKTEAT